MVGNLVIHLLVEFGAGFLDLKFKPTIQKAKNIFGIICVYFSMISQNHDSRDVKIKLDID